MDVQTIVIAVVAIVSLVATVGLVTQWLRERAQERAALQTVKEGDQP